MKKIPLHQDHEPIPGEILARMTKPKAVQPIFQVNVETRAGKLLPVGPAGCRQFCEQFIAAIHTKIASGQERDWSNPHIATIL